MAGVKMVGSFFGGIKMVNKWIWNGKWKLNGITMEIKCFKPFYFAMFLHELGVDLYIVFDHCTKNEIGLDWGKKKLLQ